MAKENTGLQIGLIFFVIVSIGLGVAFYMGSTDLTVEKKKTETALTEKAEAIKKFDDANNDNLKFRTWLGFNATDKIDLIEEKRLAIYKEHFSPNTPPDTQNFKSLVEQMAATIRQKETALDKADRDFKALVASTNAKILEHEAAAGKHKSDADETAGKVAGLEKAFNDQLGGIRDKNDGGAAKINELNKSIEALRAELKAETEKRDSTIEQLTNRLQTFKKKYDAITRESFDVAQGKITFVSQRENIVYINLGRDDRLKKGISFSVFAPSENKVGQGEKKGTIEIIDVVESHAAQAKIVDHKLSNPVMPGDAIWSPVWTPGQQQHFAIAGMIDIDGDGLSDRQRIRDLILLNGGVIDADHDDKGTMSGALTHSTRYLVVGEMPNEKTDPLVQETVSKMIAQAERFNIEKIQVSKFLGLVGYTPKATSGSAKGASAFKPRDPKQAGDGKAGSAFKTPAKAAEKADKAEE